MEALPLPEVTCDSALCEVAVDAVLGRHLVATRPIAAGTLIMRCEPLVIGPKLLEEPVCLGCCRVLDTDPDAAPCPGCGWPLCPPPAQCQRSPWHRLECDAMQAAGFRMGRDCEDVLLAGAGGAGREDADQPPGPGPDPHPQSHWYAAIVPLRCLLLPAAERARVSALQSHLAERLLSPAYAPVPAPAPAPCTHPDSPDCSGCSGCSGRRRGSRGGGRGSGVGAGAGYQRTAASFIRDTMRLRQFTEEDILAMAARLDTNAFDISQGDIRGRALYYSASMMAHDCLPNAHCCLLSRDADGDAEELGLGPLLGVLAQRVVAPGAAVCISYYADTLRGSLQRRRHLRATKYFACGCARCGDPRELGLALDSIRCIACRDHADHGRTSPTSLLVPTTPLPLAGEDGVDADWECEDPDCGFALSGQQMVLGHRALRADVDAVVRRLDRLGMAREWRDVHELAVETADAARAAEGFLAEHLGPGGVLHPTSEHALRVKYALVTCVYGHRLGYSFQEMDDEQLEHCLLLCRGLLEVADVLDAGLGVLRGSILLELHGAVLERAKRGVARPWPCTGTVREVDADVGTALEMFREAQRIFQDPRSKLALEDRGHQLEQWLAGRALADRSHQHAAV